MKHRQIIIAGIVAMAFGVLGYSLTSTIIYAIVLALMSGYVAFNMFSTDLNPPGLAGSLILVAALLGIDTIEVVKQLSPEVRVAIKLLVGVSGYVGLVRPVGKKRESNA